MFVILLACSKSKQKLTTSCRTDEMYTGAIHKKAADIAKKHDIQTVILSAKYKWLWPSIEIEYYQEVFKKQFRGPWPPDDVYGFYVGGVKYFGAAPERFRPLIKKNPMGYMLQELTELQNDFDRTKELLQSHPLHGV